jgi:hypothetical protein
MTTPPAAAWRPPPGEPRGRPPSYSRWRVGDWLNQERDARDYVAPARVGLALEVVRRAGASVTQGDLYVVAYVVPRH